MPLLRALLCLLLLAPVAPVAIAAEGAVGEISFVIGDSRLTAGPDAPRELARGAAVRVGQRLETGENGHVHIRFVDGAFVALRPNTRLRIEDYHYIADRPGESRVKFSLEDGTVRSITGRAGEAARERFRLNTPIAAIGVKGTDFLAQAAGRDTVRVSVNSGAIVLAPFGEGCLVEALGPCNVAAARELTAAMLGRYLEFRARNPLPELLQTEPGTNGGGRFGPTPQEEPRSGRRNGDAAAAPAAPAASSSADTPGSTRVGTAPSVPPPAAAIPAAPPPQAITAELAPVVAEISAAAAMTASERVLPPPVRFEGTPRIWWGRWQPYADPAQPGSGYAEQLSPDRELAGGRGIFGLLRERGSGRDFPATGRADFSLARSEAYLVDGRQLTSMTVSGGRLGIDFDNRAFDTTIAVSGASLPEIQMSARGGIQADGRFLSRPSQSSMDVSGTLAAGGAQAGYAFQRLLGAGASISGATLWVR
ncbi:MAG: FecR family protein [Sulfurisoma sp.]|nr:FecR family protein [Sulfurisoma sp.]